MVRIIQPALDPRLTEASGLVPAAQSGRFYSFNDSGHDQLLFAIDSAGNSVRVWHVAGARNRDWEAAARGPCTSDASEQCIYIGDTGDNAEKRPTIQLYRIRESQLGASGPDTVVADRLDVRYADGPRDVEAMVVTPKGTVLLLTKRPKRDAARQVRESLVLALHPDWTSRDTMVAQVVDSLPIRPASVTGQITDATLSPDGTQLVVRTYGELYRFEMDTVLERPRRSGSGLLCYIGAHSPPVGEGVAMIDRDTFLLMSEGNRAALTVVKCSTPTPP